LQNAETIRDVIIVYAVTTFTPKFKVAITYETQHQTMADIGSVYEARAKYLKKMYVYHRCVRQPEMQNHVLELMHVNGDLYRCNVHVT